MSAPVQKLRARYPVLVEAGTIRGVSITTLIPVGAVSPTNRRRILIDVAGRDITDGLRGQGESIGIVGVGKIKVVSINDHQTGSYSEVPTKQRLETVYRALLQQYKPNNIGVFGCSGGRLEEMAWLQKQGLPMPGAIAVLTAPPFATTRRGDSMNLYHTALTGELPPSNRQTSVAPTFPPELTRQVLANTPDILFISGTRDPFLSSNAVAQATLENLGVRTELHVWEGMEHGVLLFPDLPESQEVSAVVAKFFEEHLGRTRHRKESISPENTPP